jgi:hypothetical protein
MGFFVQSFRAGGRSGSALHGMVHQKAKWNALIDTVMVIGYG